MATMILKEDLMEILMEHDLMMALLKAVMMATKIPMDALMELLTEHDLMMALLRDVMMAIEMDTLKASLTDSLCL